MNGGVFAIVILAALAAIFIEVATLVAVELAEPGEETDFQAEDNYIFIRLTRENLAALGVNYLITPRSLIEKAEMISYDEKDKLYIWKLE